MSDIKAQVVVDDDSEHEPPPTAKIDSRGRRKREVVTPAASTTPSYTPVSNNTSVVTSSDGDGTSGSRAYDDLDDPQQVVLKKSRKSEFHRLFSASIQSANLSDLETASIQY